MDHRRHGKSLSARIARDLNAYGDDDLYRGLQQGLDAQKRTKQSKPLLFLLLILVLIAIAVAYDAPKLSPQVVSFSSKLSKSNSMVKGATSLFSRISPIAIPVKLHDDFMLGASDWVGTKSSAWIQEAGRIRPGDLKIWKPSIQLSDYKFEFEGQINRQAMSWAFRAPDLRNYYATKIVVHHTSALPSAEIIRYTMLNGQERSRRRLPLPLSIRPETLYHVEVSVRGDHFVTRINRQVVDVWSDTRLKRGGVGFFNEQGESSAIHWVDVREDYPGFFSKLFGIGFFVNPAITYSIEP
ncbi:MAG: hypothetical protein K7J46_16860 [Bryobacter sp.]|nr:hypothetical protein [Bryobacter sp. CoA8 C33]